jgi:hypothetical protein
VFFAGKERESHPAFSLQASKGYAGNLAVQFFGGVIMPYAESA